jgi:3-oxoacyl-[acyl-carrier-protein] synthase II
LNAHATSTPAGDIAEAAAIEKVFQHTLSNLHISSTKGVTGHLLGASGAIESVISVLALTKQCIPPSININKREEKINNEIQIVENIFLKKKINAVMNNNFGFGGHNSSLIFKLFSK